MIDGWREWERVRNVEIEREKETRNWNKEKNN